MPRNFKRRWVCFVILVANDTYEMIMKQKACFKWKSGRLFLQIRCPLPEVSLFCFGQGYGISLLRIRLLSKARWNGDGRLYKKGLMENEFTTWISPTTQRKLSVPSLIHTENNMKSLVSSWINAFCFHGLKRNRCHPRKGITFKKSSESIIYREFFVRRT